MIQETCRQIGELKVRWLTEHEERYARREKIRRIDELINEFELLNLAEEPLVPAELTAQVTMLLRRENHEISRRPLEAVSILDWMDALYDVQDSLMIEVEDDIE
ncbi:MAG: hypothetical protein ABR564_06455 [Candidatus Dormibacteria bacterium]